MTYNLTNVTDANNIYALIKGANELGVPGLYAGLFLVSIFFVMFIAMKRYDTPTVFVAASFVTTIVASLMFFLGIINSLLMILTTILFFASLLYKLSTG